MIAEEGINIGDTIVSEENRTGKVIDIIRRNDNSFMTSDLFEIQWRNNRVKRIYLDEIKTVFPYGMDNTVNELVEL